MMIYPAVHYTMGGVWVDYDWQQFLDVSQSGEANFSDHEQTDFVSCINAGLADGYFVLPYTIETIWQRYRTGKSQ
jgi:succinate dehydrogenase / fumarate reductase flavoprotein subunit